MTLAAEHQLEHIGETCGCEDHDHDLINDLSRRLDFMWRCDQFIANADGHPELQKFWRDMKKQEMDNIKRQKTLIADEIKGGCF